MHCDVLVIGAGPGGCAAALALRQAGWRVILVERLAGPADKLCGEFLSPEGVQSLGRLGLGEALGVFPRIGELLVSSLSGQCWQASLPNAGLGSSRRRLDALLLAHCAAAGVEVVQGEKVRRMEGNLAEGFRTTLKDAPLRARLVVGAWGRQGRAGKKGELMALKVHARGQWPGVELHSFPGGYAGLCQVGGNEMNLCLLTRVDAFRRAGGDCRRFSAEVMSQNSLLASRLEEMSPDWDQALAAANLTFGPSALALDGMLLVGDAGGGIAPLCGDGMAMALRAGELLAPLGDRFLRGALGGPALSAQYAQRWQGEFRLRLRLGGLLQRVLMHPGGTHAALTLLRRVPWLGQQLFSWTRGK
ncbi:MAG: FAD-binding protein [Candidatus Latescibacteria bacterium]|nr:FAD-binding protein [Candidatus Latescibacterota bacterium]